MASDKKMLQAAADTAIQGRNRRNDARTFLLGAVGIRNDGVLVSSKNIASTDCAPHHHAETRLVRKLTPGSTVWVARVAKGTGNWAMARPCPNCERRLRGSGVTKIVYTIGPNEWGVIEL